MRCQRRVVRRFEHLSALCELGLHVAQIAYHFARLLHGRHELLLERFRIERGMGTVVPIDLQTLSSLQRRPCVVGNDRHSAQRLEAVGWFKRIDGHRLLDAFHGQCILVIHAADGASEDRRMFDRCVHHAVTIDVETEGRLAGCDIREIVDRAFLAHEFPPRLFFKFQVLFLRDRKAASCGNKRAVSGLASARTMQDFVVFCNAFRRGNIPLSSGGGDEHRARCSAGLSKRIIEIADRSGAVGILIAISRIADSLFDPDAAPVRVEFVGRNQRQ